MSDHNPRTDKAYMYLNGVVMVSSKVDHQLRAYELVGFKKIIFNKKTKLEQIYQKIYYLTSFCFI